jgi:hypothetical protein
MNKRFQIVRPDQDVFEGGRKVGHYSRRVYADHLRSMDEAMATLDDLKFAYPDMMFQIFKIS